MPCLRLPNWNRHRSPVVARMLFLSLTPAKWNWFITRCRQRSRGDLGIPKATWGEKRPRPNHDPAFRKILAIAVIVFQLRVVTGTPKILSSWPR